ncbi:monovalent cation/H+ antiporter complex subunit F [Methanoplanus limicola]|uniref:Membrane bound hydrogenase subunit mbhB n=1 Tax=Methanoplanus limicola DSM 2279 TaxID=937775 RepID=H1Z3R6_9EURY|nr:monovalent cation/H+ antiporter complex subunit F [Methanoplanus limicola]EHQ35665.1 Membrane bound hydrogenase subunit mbhB [Methanoplanus limicola DSM 2279]
MKGIWIIPAIFLVMLILLAMVRLFAGPTSPDRVVAFDSINTLTVALMVILGIFFGELFFVEVAIVYALLSFVGTLFISKYLGGEI